MDVDDRLGRGVGRGGAVAGCVAADFCECEHPAASVPASGRAPTARSGLGSDVGDCGHHLQHWKQLWVHSPDHASYTPPVPIRCAHGCYFHARRDNRADGEARRPPTHPADQPRDAVKTFRVRPGFHVELAASEPNVDRPGRDVLRRERAAVRRRDARLFRAPRRETRAHSHARRQRRRRRLRNIDDLPRPPSLANGIVLVQRRIARRRLPGHHLRQGHQRRRRRR